MSKLRFAAIVIGVSAGAMEALTIILPALPRNFALPVFIVVHVPADKKSLMTELFTARCQMLVKEAEDKEKINSGTIYFAPPDYHLQVEKNNMLSLSTEAPLLYSRPSIDVLFETAADAYGNKLIGVILTGANSDGAAGLKAIMQNGGCGIIQHPETAYATAMPEAARIACPDAHLMSLEHIADYLMKAGTL